MKKVLIIGMYNQLGGIENFIYNFFKHINKEQFSFSFISMYNHIAYEEEIKILGGKIYYISNVKKNPFKCYLEIKKIIKKEKYDVVHINMLSAANIIPLKAAKKAKTGTSHPAPEVPCYDIPGQMELKDYLADL